MEDLSDLVRDMLLSTEFKGKRVVHSQYDEGNGATRRESWESMEELGSGGFGTVYRQRHAKRRGRYKERAVKVISKEMSDASGIDYASELEAIAKFSYGKVSVLPTPTPQGPSPVIMPRLQSLI